MARTVASLVEFVLRVLSSSSGDGTIRAGLTAGLCAQAWFLGL